MALQCFYSKDGILAKAPSITALFFPSWGGRRRLTTFYMFRLVFVVFFGPPNLRPSGTRREISPVIAWPSFMLAVFSAIGGFIGIEQAFAKQFSTEQVEGASHYYRSAFGLMAVLIGFAGAYALYFKTDKDPHPGKTRRAGRAR